MARSGPPSKLTQHRTALILEAADFGLSLPECAHYAGIGERTLHTWLKRGQSGEEPFHSLAVAVRSARARATSIASRFWANVRVPLSASGCWSWQGYLNPEGYGRIWVGERQIGAHRASYELHNGPIPEGMEIDHLCRSPECVNPLHLEAVTKRENARRGISPVAKQMDQTHCKRGHDQRIPENVYQRPSGGTMCRLCQEARRRAAYLAGRW